MASLAYAQLGLCARHSFAQAAASDGRPKCCSVGQRTRPTRDLQRLPSGAEQVEGHRPNRWVCYWTCPKDVLYSRLRATDVTLQQPEFFTGRENSASYIFRLRKNLLLPHHSDTRDAMSSHWHPRAMVAALASACLVFHWVLVVLFRSLLYRDLTEIEILPWAGRVGSAQAKR